MYRWLTSNLAIALLLMSDPAASFADPPPAQAKSEPELAGTWEGTISAGGIPLRLGVMISKTKEGTFTGRMVSIDQGGAIIPISKITEEKGKVVLDLPLVGGKFEGAFLPTGELNGEWSQSMMKFPLKLKRVDKLSTLNRPQTPKKPYPYTEEEVVYDNPIAKIRLAGALTIPTGPGPFPAVLLITGSGPQDRDETLFGHKPFLVIADHLTRKGIVVLRVDDRGVGKSGGNPATATTVDFVDDVLSGVAFLKSRKEVDPKRIGLLGHSEGGTIAPMAAAKSADVAFIILLAGTGLNGEEIARLQSRLMAQAEGATEEVLNWNAEFLDKCLTLLKEEPDDAKVKAKFPALVDETLKKLRANKDAWPKVLKDLGLGAEAPEEEAFKRLRGPMDAALARLANPWMRYFLALDPAVALKQVKCPVLALFGELDLQVPAKENFAAMEKAFRESGHKDVTLKIMPKLNHLFQTAKTGGLSEYGLIEETMSPAVLDLMASWILERK